MNNIPLHQSNKAKKAESERPFAGTAILDQPDLAAMHRGRALAATADFEGLRQSGVGLDQFIEIGAGSVQRSAALANNFGVTGVATDISIKSLWDAPFVLTLMGFSRMPIRICCDAHNLPFLSDTFQFAFAYQTVHHFSNPVPVLTELHRVLARNGFLFLNEEPMDSRLRRIIRGQRMLSHPPTRIQTIGYRLGVEKLFWDDGKWERSLGMTEARFDYDLWKQAVASFSIQYMEVNRKLKILTRLEPSVSSILASLIGGNVKALMRKTTGQDWTESFENRLVCLDCHTPSLQNSSDNLVCGICQRIYPVVDGVIRMLPKELEEFLQNVHQE